ncbi:UNVERIFIED_CONTAM: hypothetical protein PYX00_000304 [Menopon gallinae]|uniref:Enoyl reductase (ER) domain-containing protein n=1 Tax=Menopon gallinae TaxID=328185 RepID=A0AAW2I9H3_9NEOP
MSLRVLCRLTNIQRQVCSFSTTTKSNERDTNYDKINSWQIHSYGDLDEVQYTRTRPPIIKDPNSVVVKVLAASINPLDVAMINGYGSVLLNFMRQAKKCSLQKELEFPLTLGRDFAGIVIRTGHSVGDKVKVGDEVWGVVPPHEQGSHAEEVMVSKNYIEKKPGNISMVEAGSMLYAAITAWSALKITGDIAVVGVRGRNVLVLGGSGGVGTMAVQMLRNWGAKVVTTCSEDAIPLLRSLGAHDVFDYRSPDFHEQIGKRKYDIILDCAGLGQENGAHYCRHLKDYSLSKFITLKSPMLRNVDDYGLLGGMIKNVGDFLFVNASAGCLPKSSSIRWGFFIPLERALTEITKDVEDGKILPCVHKIYSFDDVPNAYKHAAEGHLRGKIVIDMSSLKTEKTK